ncbi:MAG: hypothetical protein HFH41_05405 [Lachnospiraceae bacterium]|nr:hypothetical protein [Lachnospiraceae bacterium]
MKHGNDTKAKSWNFNGSSNISYTRKQKGDDSMNMEHEKDRSGSQKDSEQNASDHNTHQDWTGRTTTGPLPSASSVRQSRKNWKGAPIIGPLPGTNPARSKDRRWIGRTTTGPLPKTVAYQTKNSDH